MCRCLSAHETARSGSLDYALRHRLGNFSTCLCRNAHGMVHPANSEPVEQKATSPPSTKTEPPPATKTEQEDWTSGGTLATAKMSDWMNATDKNRLATSSDFVGGILATKYGGVAGAGMHLYELGKRAGAKWRNVHIDMGEGY